MRTFWSFPLVSILLMLETTLLSYLIDVIYVSQLHSLQAFVKDASSFSHEAVDRLLDVLTEGAHSKYVHAMAEVRSDLTTMALIVRLPVLMNGL